MPPSVDFLTVHFGRPCWTELLVESVREVKDSTRLRKRYIHIVDNCRDGLIRESFQNKHELIFHEFPVDNDQMEFYHHDHAASLSRGVERSDAEILVVLDCDAHIRNPLFLEYVADRILDRGEGAVAAPDRRYGEIGLSHPCFLILSRQAREVALPFDSRQLNSEKDVGRLISTFLMSRGMKVHVPIRMRTFGGAWGEIFDDQVYHHGSATFGSSQSTVITRQVNPYAWHYDRCVIKHRRFNLNLWEKWLMRVHSRIPTIRWSR